MNHSTPPISLTPSSGQVNAQEEVCTFGLRVDDAGAYRLQLHGSAPLAATLIDEDGVTVSALKDGDGANPLEFDMTLSPGAYVLHLRAAHKGDTATIRAAVAPLH